MGTLIAKCYPTKLFLKLADHTYVECGTGGKAWACWGGKTGGTALRGAPGSTNRADKIAQPDEKAGIKCYLINGVCHQAANRILLPAGITVRGARGYSVSQALFGPYGKVGTWPCKSPFRRYPGASGDIPACVSGGGMKASALFSHIERSGDDKADWQYIQKALSIYDEAETRLKMKSLIPVQAREMQLKLFELMVDFELGPQVRSKQMSRMMAVREKAECLTEDAQAGVKKDRGSIREYAETFNKITERFQDEMANLLSSKAYEMLFGLKPDERVFLADPEVMSREYSVDLKY